QKSRAKLDGTYHDGLRLTINRRRHESVLRDPVCEKENRKRTYRKNRKKRIADMKEYNKKYYQQHREKLLKRQKGKAREESGGSMKRYSDCIRTDGLCGLCSAS
ncbi:hypothetical protein NE556_23210, partial [[Clostridium] symbiosum]|nr:hypothetical protein [[Clostridium] symbiosum]